ncbi:MAG TPA: leucyl aminopeptidase [Streptosporangiaceae bacterium]
MNALTTSTAAARSAAADALIIGVTETPDGPVPAPGSEDADGALAGSLAATLAAVGATGKQDELTRIASAGRLTAPLILAVGLGKLDNGERARSESLRRAAGAAVRALAGQRAGSVAIALPSADAADVEAVALGALLGGYAYSRYRAPKGSTPDLTVLTAADGADDAAARARALAEAMALTRDLVNTSPLQLYPETFAAEAAQVAEAHGLAVEILDDSLLTRAGYGGLIGVGQGSAHPPRLARLAYTHAEATKTVVLVGKGITFDSGGLSLKPSKSMETMKSDMAGAAAVLGALQALTALRPVVNVVGYLAMAENMPGGNAQRPSDVITIFGGKTVEVLNTDAEGRLVMADCLARSGQDSPDLLVDVATLTGAKVVALGMELAGVMGSDDEVAAAVADAAGRAGERAWPMPLPEELRKGLDSTVADIANVSGQPVGGMLTAGLFLKEFVPDGVRWAHVDIAGTAFHEGEAYGYTPKGGTGAAVRTLVQVATDVADGRL